MARRRGQQTGHVHRQGDCWYLAYREDAIGEDGKIVRVRVSAETLQSHNLLSHSNLRYSDASNVQVTCE